MKPIQKIAAVSIAVGGLVFAGKMLAAKVSGSTALFSDALEALVNVASSALALYALVIGAKPADERHNYGHAKAELLSAIATGAMVLLAALLYAHWILRGETVRYARRSIGRHYSPASIHVPAVSSTSWLKATGPAPASTGAARRAPKRPCFTREAWSWPTSSRWRPP